MPNKVGSSLELKHNLPLKQKFEPLFSLVLPPTSSKVNSYYSKNFPI